MRTVLITGAAGLIGRPSVVAFAREGWTVIATDIRKPPIPDGYPDVVVRQLAIHEITAGDLVDVDVVVHLGALTLSAEKQRFGAGSDINDARDIVGVNVLGTEQVFRLSAEAGVRVVVYASTAAVYGAPAPEWDARRPYPSNGPFRPGSLYAHTKLMCEGLAAHYAQESTTRFIGIRPTFSFGLERLSGISGSFAQFIVDALEGREAVLGAPFGRSGRLQLIYVEDMARSLVAAAMVGVRPGSRVPASIVLNSPTAEMLSMEEIVEILKERSGNDRVSVREPHFDAQLVMPDMDTSEAIALLDFQQEFPFAEAVDDIARKLGAACD